LLGSFRPRSDGERDLSDKAGKNEQTAKPVAVALVCQEYTTEADKRSERHSDLASSIHVGILQRFRERASPALSACRPWSAPRRRETIGEKREQSKNKKRGLVSFQQKFRARRSQAAEQKGVSLKTALQSADRAPSRAGGRRSSSAGSVRAAEREPGDRIVGGAEPPALGAQFFVQLLFKIQNLRYTSFCWPDRTHG
jgi:hypothetical protein